MARNTEINSNESWFTKNHRERGKCALRRQLEYQEKKASQLKGQEEALFLGILNRAKSIRERLNEIHSIKETDKILEVGSGAHGLIFGFDNSFAIGIAPLAADHIIHFTQERVLEVFKRLPFEIMEQTSTIESLKKSNRQSNSKELDWRQKNFLNALLEIIALGK